VFVADLTVELRAWPRGTWAKVGIDPQAAAAALVAGWRRGDLPVRGHGSGDSRQDHPGVSARLRDQVDLETLSEELVVMVEETMQPTCVALRLRARTP
jgi:hypothetical protein